RLQSEVIMAKIHLTRLRPAPGLCCLAGLTLLACHARGQGYDPDWARNLRIGSIVGLNINANFSMNGKFNISRQQPGVYDNGYVRVDQTGNAQGYTSFWGYNDSSQYNPANQTLRMDSSSSFTTSGGANDKSDSPYFGLDMAYGGMLWHKNFTRIGWE